MPAPQGLQGPVLDWYFPDGSDGKESNSACSVRDLGSIPWSGRSPAEGNGIMQYYWRITSMDRGYSSWGGNESETTEKLTLAHFATFSRAIL